MAQHILDLLKERGFIAQMTFEDELYEQLKNPTTFYVGFDPTADSLHIGHYIPIMAMAHMQRAGHRPIALMGGGTAMIGDPSGKTDMRKMMTVETIDTTLRRLNKQISRFLDFSEGKRDHRQQRRLAAQPELHRVHARIGSMFPSIKC